jgi:hypothetical protein
MSDRTNVLIACALLVVAATISVGAVMVTEPAATTTTATTAAETISIGEEATATPSETMTVEPGETVTVSVWANASAVSGYQTRLTFDPAVVRVEEVSGSDDFADPVANVDNDAGSVDFNQVRGSDAENPVLAEITLTVVGEVGESAALSFDRSGAGTKFATDGGQTFTPQTYGDVTVSVEET